VSSSSTEEPGSAAEEPRVTVGYVKRAHGIAGSLLVVPLTDIPQERFRPGARLEVAPGGRSLVVSAVRPHREGLLVDVDGVADRDSAEELRGATLTIGRSQRRSLDADEFWEDDLVGLEVCHADGRVLGVVSAVVTGAAQDRLVVATSGADKVEVPFVSAIVVEVDVATGRVVVDPPEGLF
jgi:16S rRNA processing protein RimM